MSKDIRTAARAVATWLGGVAALVLVAACATRPDDPCDPRKAAAVGAVAGVLIGAVTGTRDKALAVGAAAGGAIGALGCMAVNVQTRQTRSAAAVTADAQARLGQLPPQATLVSYSSELLPPLAQPGGQIKVRTVIEVAHGRQEAATDVKEQLVLVDTDGREHPLSVKNVGEGRERAGRFENSFSFALPGGVSRGAYVIRTSVLVNGRKAGERAATLSVAALAPATLAAAGKGEELLALTR